MFNLHESQKQVAIDPHRFRILCCGRRWGKTTLAIDQMKARSAIPDSRICYVAPTYQQARDIAWEALRKDYSQAADINETRLEISVVNGSKIFLRGWESIESLRGQKFDFIVLDEVAMMKNFWGNWQEVIRPTLTDTKGEGLFISTPKGFNDFYELFGMEGKDTDFKSFHFSTYDNPFIPKEEVDKAKKELTEDRFAQEYMADFRKTEGLVFKEFMRGWHLFDEVKKSRTIIRIMGGIDFGFTNPTAILEVKKDKYACYYVYERLYKTGMTDIQTAEYTAALNWEACYPDPEAPAAIEELKRHNVNVREVVKGKDSIPKGINVIRELFKQNRLVIHRSAKNLIWELETYSYPDKKPDHPESELPIHENCHAIDALRYVLMMDNSATYEHYDPPLNWQTDETIGLNPAE